MHLEELEAEAPVDRGYIASAAQLIASEPGRRVDRERDLDLAVLAWAARFAFVTSATLAWRWRVSEQKMRKRVRRLERERYVRRVRVARSEPDRVVLTGRGRDACGLQGPAAKGMEPLGHELAVIKRVMAIDEHFGANGIEGARAMTERDMRRDELREGGRRWAVGVVLPSGRRAKRWPDYAVETPDGTTAVELEFSLKGTGRLRSIVRGYEDTTLYDFVDFVVLGRRQDAQLRRTLGRLIDDATAERMAWSDRLNLKRAPKLRLVPWRDPLPGLHAGIAPFPPIQAAL